MILTLITNQAVLAKEADRCGIERILIDLERKGKEKRQEGKGLFLSDHTMENIPEIKSVLTNARLMVRINKLNHKSKEEIDAVIEAGADLIMLPYFHQLEEVTTFLDYVNSRIATSLLVETGAAIKIIKDLVALEADEIHIGLNDLKISMNFKSIFEPLHNGTIAQLCRVIKDSGKLYGFGGIGGLSRSDLPISPERILAEQIRLGCSIGWLGRTFRDIIHTEEGRSGIMEETTKIRNAILKWENASETEFEENRKTLYHQIINWESSIT